MIDFHSHILPDFDDGAENIEMSCQMLKESKRQGVNTVISTSHCILEKESDIENFLNRRKESYERLMPYIRGDDFPQVRLGAEVGFRFDVSECSRLKELCIEGTDYMLLEMPWNAWTEATVEQVYNITITGIKPVMAHIERFLYQDSSLIANLFELDVHYQINCSAMIRHRRDLQKLWQQGRVHVIGSDMHNTTSRPPTMHEAKVCCEKHFSAEHWRYLQKNAALMLENKAPERVPEKLRKKGFKFLFGG